MAIETTTFKVVGDNVMHCGGCEKTVKFALGRMPGVEQVEASHKTQLIRVAHRPETIDPGRIQQELDWIGYQVEAAQDADD